MNLQLIWLIVLTLISLISLILVLITVFQLIPTINLILTQILRREQTNIAMINKLKMVMKFEEGIDLDKELPFDVKIEPAEVTENKKE